ncbi:MAG TPA: DUF3237 domain-containing protein [Polyangiales bacterium]|nr:DUF3237 domain-containing protein [Polyangiales bacterium]
MLACLLAFVLACLLACNEASDSPPADGASPVTGAGSPAPAGGGGQIAPPAAGSAGAAVGMAGSSAVAGAGAGSGGAPVAGQAGQSPPAVDGGADAATSDGSMPAPALDANATVMPHPSWDCGMPEGIPAPSSGMLAFEAELTVGEIHDLGETQFGRRQQIDVTGGTVHGPEIDGRFLTGGVEYQLSLVNGVQEVEGVHVLRTDDNAPIYLRTCAVAPGAGEETRVVADFEAGSSGGYAWLNTGGFVGTRTFDAAQRTLRFSLYRVEAAPAGAAVVRVTEPDGLVQQTWACKVASGTPGTEVYRETVGIGGSISVGASKRGTRNVIPITGGTFSGRLKGEILAGGGDYQLFGAAFELDARYTLRTDDDQLIIVRNCGPVGGLVPVFEASKSGPYAWLNANTWLSSDPGISVGAVNLTIYETR